MAEKARLYPADGQIPTLEMHCTHARFVYNLGLEQRSMWRPGRRGIGLYEQKRQLTEARAAYEWLRKGASVVQQQALFDLARTFQAFYDGRAGYPRFRRRGISESFVVTEVSVRRVSRRFGMVLIPKLGWVRFRAHRDWARYASATSARVKLARGQWHITFTTQPAGKIAAASGAVLGIDRGVANTIATSDGDLLHIPGLTAGEQVRLQALTLRLARQTRAAKRDHRPLSMCRNRQATARKLEVLSRRLDNRRKDWVEQTTTKLARNYTLVALEDLNIQSMTRRPAPKPIPETPGAYGPNGARAKAGLNRKIFEARWGELHQRLTDKMPVGAVVLVNAHYTSQQCPSCGHTSSENRESQAVFACRACGYNGHADITAAKNILARAISEPEVIGGSPASAAASPCRRNQRRAAA